MKVHKDIDRLHSQVEELRRERVKLAALADKWFAEACAFRPVGVREITLRRCARTLADALGVRPAVRAADGATDEGLDEIMNGAG